MFDKKSFIICNSCLRGEVDIMRPSEGRVTGSIPVGGTTKQICAKAMLVPVDIAYHRQSKELELTYENAQSFRLPAEYLRVLSPSAEVQGHTPEQARVPVGKRDVSIVGIEPVGLYALKIVFSDGHDSGYYDWDYLRKLAIEKEALWQDYLVRLDKLGASRDPDDPRNEPFKTPLKKACHH